VDDTLPALPGAGVMDGVLKNTPLLMASQQSPETWQKRFPQSGPFMVLDELQDENGNGFKPLRTMACAGAAAGLVGLSREILRAAVLLEMKHLPEDLLARNLEYALGGWERVAVYSGTVQEKPGVQYEGFTPPNWIVLQANEPRIAQPTIYGGSNSQRAQTGLWRTERPAIDPQLCKQCWWVCTTFCPDNAVLVGSSGIPEIDYDHCKGCMICMEQCPPHAIQSIPEVDQEVIQL